MTFDVEGSRAHAGRLLDVEDDRLVVLSSTEVVGVTLDARGAATGVRLADGRSVLATRSVVVAAGPEESVRLLVRSGVTGRGGAVGRGVFDHPSVAVPVVDARRPLRGRPGPGGVPVAAACVAAACGAFWRTTSARSALWIGIGVGCVAARARAFLAPRAEADARVGNG